VRFFDVVVLVNCFKMSSMFELLNTVSRGVDHTDDGVQNFDSENEGDDFQTNETLKTTSDLVRLSLSRPFGSAFRSGRRRTKSSSHPQRF
jgi:hypothetical protein